jgi:hypothetical protein
MLTTDDLIARLGQHVTPARRLATPAARTALWAAGAASYLLVMGLWDLTQAARLPALTSSYLMQEGASLLLGFSAAYLAFASVVPGLRTRAGWVVTAFASGWILSLLWGAAQDFQTSGSLGLTGRSDWSCVLTMAVSAAVLAAPLIVMMRRGAALAPRSSVFLAGLAAVGVANVEACLIRPHAFEAMVLVWHGGTIVVVTAVCAWMGRRWLPWPPDYRALRWL